MADTSIAYTRLLKGCYIMGYIGEEYRDYKAELM